MHREANLHFIKIKFLKLKNLASNIVLLQLNVKYKYEKKGEMLKTGSIFFFNILLCNF